MKTTLHLAAVILIGGLSAHAQASAHKPSTAVSTPPVVAAKTTAPATPAPPTPSKIAEVSADTAKQVDTLLNLEKLADLNVTNARTKFTQNDPVGQQAIKVLNDALLNDQDYTNAMNILREADAKTNAKIAELRKALGLDDSWQWNFQTHQFVQLQKSPSPPASVAAK